MDTAFETETKKLVKAWAIGRDSSYIMPENDIFIANKDEICNYEQKLKEHKLDFIECRFRKGHLRSYQDKVEPSFVIPHFFIPNKSKLGIETLPESPEHKKIKSFIYEKFFDNDELEINYSYYKKKNETIYNKIKLKDLDIEWDLFSLKKEDFFEVGVTDTFNTRRVDLFLKFKKFNPMFGEGLVIEVQLSPQSDELTKKRTIDRALKGYSCIWINKNHFDDVKSENLQLTKEIEIRSWQATLHNNAENITTEIYEKIQRYSRQLDLKFSEISEKYEKLSAAGTLCQKCGIGILEAKQDFKKRYPPFLGCSNYPKCNNTYNLEVKKNE